MRWVIKLGKELLRILPAFLFFLVAFYLINMIEGLFLKSQGIRSFSFYEVIIAAALVAKILLVINNFPFINAFPNKPLICNVLWKTFLYELSTIVVRFGIKMIPKVVATKSFFQGYHAAVASMDIERFIAIQLCYLLLFFTFVCAEEVTLKIGPEKMRKAFFGW